MHDELFCRVLEVIGSVQAYMSTWRSTTAGPEPERKTVDDTVLDVCSQVVQPWPQIDKEPVPMYEEGRFVKSFPLAFPMGVGDLKQPRLRDDFSTAEWVQHKFRHVDGRFFNASRGHRETWAMFNQMLLDVGRVKGYAYHKSTNAAAMTKKDLRELVETQEHLVQEITAFGSDIPTTSMFWKRETNSLQWVVRQMSWCPPWISRADDRPEDDALILSDTVHAVEVIDSAASSTQQILHAPSGDVPACDDDHSFLGSGADGAPEELGTDTGDEDVLVQADPPIRLPSPQIVWRRLPTTQSADT